MYLIWWLLSHNTLFWFFENFRRRSKFSLIKALLRRKGKSYCATWPSLHSIISWNDESKDAWINGQWWFPSPVSTCSSLVSISHFRGSMWRSKFLIRMVLLRDTGWKHAGQRQLSRSQTVGYLRWKWILVEGLPYAFCFCTRVVPRPKCREYW